MSTKPMLVCLNETLLDASVESTGLGGYTLISRRDRDDGRSGGGIALFAADCIAPQMVLLEKSEDHERAWHTIHSDIGPILCGVWYRPPCPGEISSIRSCEDEWRRLTSDHVASIIIGDLNLHHTRWLRYSSSVSVEGTSMFRFCLANGLKQHVKERTRDEHLLDLVISDLEPRNVEVLPKVSDHNMVLAVFDIGIPESEVICRTVFDYGQADWQSIKRNLCAHDWRRIDDMDVDCAESYLHDSILDILRSHVPERVLKERRCVHPWVNDRCRQAIHDKNTAVEPQRAEATTKCSEVLFEEYLAYVQRMRDKLAKEKRGSKKWWTISSSIMDKASKTSTIPALKTASGWVHDAAEKANVFAEMFSSKFGIPDVEINEFSLLGPVCVQGRWVMVRRRRAEHVLHDLDLNSGTGPDGIATRVLKACSRELSFPVAKLVRRIVAQSHWPTAWTAHWLLPLYKRKSVFNPGNYRAINLTAQISKVAERILAPHFVPILESRSFGPTQFAYRKKHGARDAVALYVLSWIGALNRGEKIGVYASDVHGAFDRVSADRLIEKLSRLGLSQSILSVIRSWLRDREGFVVVAGQKSRGMRLRNMVFQGTVWGPPLWNPFFGDSVCAIESCGFEVVIYADDCNAFKTFPRIRSNDAILNELRKCQRSLHKWGRANNVTFDAGKEEFMIISTVEPLGGHITLFGSSVSALKCLGARLRRAVGRSSVGPLV